MTHVATLDGLYLVDYPLPSEQTPARDGERLAMAKPEERDRQSAVLRLLGTDQTFG